MTENEKNLRVLCVTCDRRNFNAEHRIGRDYECLIVPEEGVCDIHKHVHMRCPDYIEETPKGVIPCRLCKYWGNSDDDKKMKIRHCSVHDIPILATREICSDFAPRFKKEMFRWES